MTGVEAELDLEIHILRMALEIFQLKIKRWSWIAGRVSPYVSSCVCVLITLNTPWILHAECNRMIHEEEQARKSGSK